MNRRQKYLVSTMVSVTLAILCYLFVLAISNDHQKSWDLTQEKRYSFSQQTTDLVGSLPFEVKLYAFLDPNGDGSMIEELLDRYRRLNKRFTYEIVDLEKKPTLAESLEVRAYGQGVLEKVGSAPDKDSPPRRERIMAFDEASITNALLKLSTNETRKVAFLSGHGERAIVGGAKESLSTLVTALTGEGYKGEQIKLTETKEIPGDLALLVLAGPTGPLLPGEQALIDDYLRGGGKMLFLADITTPDSYTEWLKGYGFELGDTVIIDQAAEMAKVEPVFAIGAAYSGVHAITKNFKDITAFRLSRPVDVGTAQPLVEGAAPPELEVLVHTQKTAFVMPITEVLKNATMTFSADPNQARGYPLAAAGLYPRQASGASSSPEASPTPGASDPVEVSARIVVVGNTDSFTDRLFAFVSNRDFVLNTINWLAESENQITVRARDPKSQPLVLEKQKEKWMRFLFGFLLPFMTMLTGLLISFGRRKGIA
jgi:ABC-type uncharacterized transport system involved in gliding motility auxiliary subunit